MIEQILSIEIEKALSELYLAKEQSIQFQKTRKDFVGDITLVVFPLLRASKKDPEQTADDIGNYLKENVIKDLIESGKEIIEITEDQNHRFAGNMLQVMGDKPYIVMSNSAYNSLSESQIKIIENYCPIIYSPLDTIEACGGGSVRCMMAEIFLPKK